MKTLKIKTIDIQSKEWFDKVNGNSYFSANVTINYGLENQQNIFLPFQYGYGTHYEYVAVHELSKLKLIKKDDNNPFFSLWKYCQDNKIILRKSKRENCLKRELKY
jgi:lipoprotein NlpI